MQRVSATDLDALLDGPFLHEDFGAAATPLLAVDIDRASHAITQHTIGRLRALPGACVAVLSDDFTPDPSVAAGFDLVLAPGAGGVAPDVPEVIGAELIAASMPDALGLLERSVAASPDAAVTLVQLLRLSAEVRVRDALIAESLAYSMLQGGAKFQHWLAHGDRPTDLDDDPDVLDIDWQGDIVHLTLNRPARHNAFNAALRDSLVEALRVGLAVPDAQIVVSGRGASFCSGGDLAEFGTTPDPATAHRIRSVRSPAWWVHEGRDRISFELHGACYGAGIELPAFAHRTVAAPETRFCLPEVGFGLVPGAGGTVSVTRRIGRHRTAWLALTGKPIGVRLALAWGLIDEVRDDISADAP